MDTSSTGSILKRFNAALKKVQFHNTARVVLIPCSEEYKEADLKDVLWYNDDNFKAFREDRLKEINEHINLTGKTMTYREAMSELYQP